MSYLEFMGPPGSGKTTEARKMLLNDSTLAVGRRSLILPTSRIHVDGLGLPPDGFKMWFRLALILPYAMILGAQFWVDTKNFQLGWSMGVLLMKSRVLAASPLSWVVDQGLQQKILTALARGYLSVGCARKWKVVCLSGLWGPNRVIVKTLNHIELVSRVKHSEKHLRQCGSLSPEEYVEKHLSAYSQLSSNL